MEFTKEEKVDLVLYFHIPVSKDYEGWRKYEPYRRFEEYGFAKEDNGQVELTPEGDEYLHKFIQTETEKVILLLKNRKELWLEQILEEFDYGEDSKEFIEAKRLLKFFDYFVGIGSEFIPTNSLLREFVGGGCFRL
mgnify:CR=1 FL=1